MIADEASHSVFFLQFEDEFHNPLGIRPPVYIVSDKNNLVIFRIDRNLCNEIFEKRDATMDISQSEYLPHKGSSPYLKYSDETASANAIFKSQRRYL